MTTNQALATDALRPGPVVSPSPYPYPHHSPGRQQQQDRRRFADLHGEYTSRAISFDDTAAIQACYRLRYRYFVESTGWVPKVHDLGDEERDRYDSAAHHVGVFRGDVLVAYVRLLPWHAETGFMLDHDFKQILTQAEHQALPRYKTVEMSRLVLRRHGRHAVPRRHLTTVMCQLFWRCCVISQRWSSQRLVAVVQPERWVMLRRHFGFPLESLSASYRFADGTVAMAIGGQISEMIERLQALRRSSVAKI